MYSHKNTSNYNSPPSLKTYISYLFTSFVTKTVFLQQITTENKGWNSISIG